MAVHDRIRLNDISWDTKMPRLWRGILVACTAYMRKAELFFAGILLPLDFIALIAAGLAAYSSRFHPIFTSIRPVAFDLPLDRYTPLVMVVALVWMFIFSLIGLYKIERVKIWDEMIKVVLASSAGVAAILGILFFSRELFESRFIVLAAWVFAVLFVCSERLLVRGLQKTLLTAGIGVRHVAIIGKNKTAEVIRAGFAQKPSLGLFVIAQFDTFDEHARKKLLALKAKGELDEIMLADSDTSRKVAQELFFFTDTEQLTFKYTADLFSAASARTRTHTYAGVPVVEVKKTPLEGWGAIYKRTFDVVGSFLLIVVTLPLQILIAVALFVEQPGRVLFSRLPDGEKVMRIGEGGRKFHYFKFRSMVKNAHTYRFDPTFIKKYGNMREGTPLFKLKDDPRVTPVGKFIRKLSLDELPEFYLVFMGRMSLVGPRPHLPEEVERYAPWQRKVLTVRPGITGMAQISGRADLDFDEEVRLDIFYIEHWGPLMDFYVLAKTPFAVLFRKGAY